ncbi:hypothetical protein ABW21_db0209097 [Orbilia brochopaga]|nr:hypothetical protein ABW21_db0209097 [Drechslerella brochopaga]
MSDFVVPTTPKTPSKAEIKALKKRAIAVYAALQVIKKSEYADHPRHWNWALLMNVAHTCGGLPAVDSDVYREGFKRACELAGAVWTKYYAPRGMKRKVPDDTEVEDAKDADTNIPSLKKMAIEGLSFKLDWNSQNMGVKVFRDEEQHKQAVTIVEETLMSPMTPMDKLAAEKAGWGNADAMVDDMESPNQKENERLIKKPSSIYAKLGRRAMAQRQGSLA